MFIALALYFIMFVPATRSGASSVGRRRRVLHAHARGPERARRRARARRVLRGAPAAHQPGRHVLQDQELLQTDGR